MKLSAKDCCEINRIIGEALGWKSVPPSGSIYDPDGKHTGLIDFPDFCGDDAVAGEAIKALVMQGVHLDLHLARGAESGKYHVVCGIDTPRYVRLDGVYGAGIGGDNPIAAALKNTMVCKRPSCCECSYHPIRLQDAVKGGGNPACRLCGGTGVLMKYCLTPALEELLKQKGGESNGK